MNIIIVSQYFWPENFKVNNLCEHLSKKHNVTVLTSYPNYPKGKIFPEFKINKSKFENYHNSQIIRVFQFQRNNGKPINLFFNYISFLFFAFIKSFFLKKKFDIVITFATSPIFVALIGILISKLNKAKSIIWVLDIWPEILKELNIIKFNFVIKIIDLISTFIYKKHDLILTQSNSFKKIIKKKIKFQNKKKIVFFPSWSDEINFNIKKNKKKNKKSIDFLYTGNIGIAQNFENLVKAVELTKNSVSQKWHIVGDGRFKKNFTNLIKEYKLQKFINIHSFRSTTQLNKFFKLADFCYLALNKGKYLNSTIPGKLQTYMAYGLPILASIDGEAKKIILDAQCGIVSKPGDYKDLALKINKISKLNTKSLKLLGENAKDFSKNNFDKKKLLKKFDKLVANIN